VVVSCILISVLIFKMDFHFSSSLNKLCIMLQL
jgi:hypothetical protein